MNLILLDEGDFVAPGRARLTGRRLAHVRTVHRAAAGDQLVVGLLDGDVGTGVVTQIDESVVELAVTLDAPPPPRAEVLLLLALPRPKALRRILQHLSALGVDQIVLLNAYRVEKSFWSSPVLSADSIDAALRLGLEQARDTRRPSVRLERRFKPFVEDSLPQLAAGRRCLLAHPHRAAPCPHSVSGPLALAVGPEGGWIDFERGLLEAAGFDAVSLGPRILRTESALSVLLGRLL
jgi:16S rRNA (uracil1498-N3)-methyltransferase